MVRILHTEFMSCYAHYDLVLLLYHYCNVYYGFALIKHVTDDKKNTNFNDYIVYWWAYL